MSPTHEPIRQLEPSNLLEPLDLPEPAPEPVESTPSAARERRWALKPALVVAGALVCVAAGAALPQLAALTRGDTKVSQTVGSATRPAESVAPAPAASDQSTPIESSANEAAGGAREVAAPAAAAAPRPWVDPVPAAPASPAAKDASSGQPRGGAPTLPATAASPVAPAVAGTPPGSAQPAAQAAGPPPADIPRAETRSYGRLEEGAQPPRENARPIDRRQSRDDNRRDGDRRVGDKAARDDARTTGRAAREDAQAGFGDAREDERVIGRTPPAPRDGERATRRVPRDDGRVVGRGPGGNDRTDGRVMREERPVLPFPFFGGGGLFGSSSRFD
jgi:hypothetical protein